MENQRAVSYAYCSLASVAFKLGQWITYRSTTSGLNNVLLILSYQKGIESQDDFTLHPPVNAQAVQSGEKEKQDESCVVWESDGNCFSC